jgi:hypothetical protein
MEDIGIKLAAINVTKMFVADDRPENLDAARAIAATMPNIRFEFFTTAAEVIQAILNDLVDVSLVLTDVEMETKAAGLDVFQLCYGYRIPVVVITEYDHGKNVHAKCASPWILNGRFDLKGSKINPNAWHEVMATFVDAAETYKNIHQFHATLRLAYKSIDQTEARIHGNLGRRDIALTLGLS